MPYSTMDVEDPYSKSLTCLMQGKLGWSGGMTALPLITMLRYRLELTALNCSNQFNVTTCRKRLQASNLCLSFPAKRQAKQKVSSSNLGCSKNRRFNLQLQYHYSFLFNSATSAYQNSLKQFFFFFPFQNSFCPTLQNKRQCMPWTDSCIGCDWKVIQPRVID